MKIATFNINNVNKRLANLPAYKAADSPRAAIEKAGYGAGAPAAQSGNGTRGSPTICLPARNWDRRRFRPAKHR
jgi:hypothetical protein